MRDPARIDLILDELSRFWHANQDLRLGQIVDNARISSNQDIFFLEDDRLLDGLRRLAALHLQSLPK